MRNETLRITSWLYQFIERKTEEWAEEADGGIFGEGLLSECGLWACNETRYKKLYLR